MGDMLKFKKGTFSGLPSTKSAGTIYVTTDEKAMYVDISNTERIRLGQIVNFDTLANFQAFLVNTSPPYDQQAFYYIEDKNALLRWKSNDGSTDINNSSANATNGTWVQINSVADVQASIENLSGTVEKIIVDVTELREEIGARDKAKKTEDGIIIPVYDRLDDIETKDEAQDASIKTLNDTVGIGDNPSENSHAKKIEALNAKLGVDTSGNSGSIYERLGQVETAASGNGANITKIQEDIAGLKTQDTKHSTAIENLQTAIGTGTGLSGRIETLENVVGVNNYDVSKAGTHTSRIETLETSLNNLQEQVLEDIGDLSSYKVIVESTYATKTELDNTSDALTKEINKKLDETTFTTHVDTYNAKVDEIEGKINENDTAIKTNASEIVQIKKDLDTKADQTALDGAISDLEDLINEKIKTADAMTYIGAVSQSSELPTTATNFAGTEGTRIGDTFVASSAFEISKTLVASGGNLNTGTNTVQVYAGDLLIARGTEGTNGYITSNLTWDVIDTGYIESHENSLKPSIDDSAILLTAHTNNELARVTFVADGALKASVDAYNNVKYTIEWEEF